MRRLVATTLLLMFVAMLVSAPAAASLTNGKPACCRAHGEHRCSAPASSPWENGLASQPLACPYSQPVLAPHAAPPQPRPAVTDSPDAHPFIMEFVPHAVPAADESSPADRGPPIASSR